MLIHNIDTQDATMAELQELGAKLSIPVGFLTDQGPLNRKATWQTAIERFVVTAPPSPPTWNSVMEPILNPQPSQIDLFSAFGRQIYEDLRDTISKALSDSLSPNQAAACATAVARIYCQQPLSETEQRAFLWFQNWLGEQPTANAQQLKDSLARQAQPLLTAAA